MYHSTSKLRYINAAFPFFNETEHIHAFNKLYKKCVSFYSIVLVTDATKEGKLFYNNPGYHLIVKINTDA